jgi:hypothetical protein
MSFNQSMIGGFERRTPDTFSAQSPMHAKKKKKNPPGANV